MIHAKDINEQSKWQELTPGCEIYEPATASMTITGEWRTMVPKWDATKCKQCLLCAPYCPDSSIPLSAASVRTLILTTVRDAASAIKYVRSRRFLLEMRRSNPCRFVKDCPATKPLPTQ